MTGVRHLLASRPRLVLAVLLAFGVELIATRAAVVHHHHAGGASAHTHGRLIAAPVEHASTRVADGLASAPSHDVHAHSVQALVGLRATAVPALTSGALVSAVPSGTAPAELPAVQRTAQARAPPRLA